MKLSLTIENKFLEIPVTFIFQGYSRGVEWEKKKINNAEKKVLKNVGRMIFRTVLFYILYTKQKIEFLVQFTFLLVFNPLKMNLSALYR